MNVWPPIVSVPCLDCTVVLAATEYEIVPLPLPLDPAVTISHEGASLDAVHAQPAGAVMDVDPVDPAEGLDALTGVNENVHPSAACVTVYVWFAIVSVPWRDCTPVFAEAAKVTVPLPLPLAPALTLNQDVALLTAVHVQPAAAVTLADPLPPNAATEPLCGETV